VNPRILVVEDDILTQELISRYLAENHLQVISVITAALAEEVMRTEAIDLVLLDLNLPDQDGLMLARKLRAEGDIPIVMLTGRTAEIDRVLGLELGADDYVSKPFSPRELLARIRSVLRRVQARPASRTQTIQRYRFAGLELRIGTRKLIGRDGKALDLTSGEFRILVAFLKSPQQILSRDQLLTASRLCDEVYDRSIDVQILRLRRKIEEDPAMPSIIKTERGAGYYLDCKVESG
jgi:DNA-binding response OmpR family regulator